MKRIIDGKRYDTTTATLVADVSSHLEWNDHAHHVTKLYRTARGNWFIAGEGGPRSQWARSTGQNSWSDGSGLRAIDALEARELLERHAQTDALEKYFEIEEG